MLNSPRHEWVFQRVCEFYGVPSRLYFCFIPNVSGIGFRPTATLTTTKWLKKMKKNERVDSFEKKKRFFYIVHWRWYDMHDGRNDLTLEKLMCKSICVYINICVYEFMG